MPCCQEAKIPYGHQHIRPLTTRFVRRPGTLPDEWRTLPLQIFDVHNNTLSGAVACSISTYPVKAFGGSGRLPNTRMSRSLHSGTANDMAYHDDYTGRFA